jgi:hypothetical protein
MYMHIYIVYTHPHTHIYIYIDINDATCIKHQIPRRKCQPQLGVPRGLDVAAVQLLHFIGPGATAAGADAAGALIFLARNRKLGSLMG